MSKKSLLLYAFLIVLAIFTLWPNNEANHEKVSNIKVWNAHIDDNGQLNVLDVVLEKSTLKQAEAVLHSQSERALFIKVKDKALQGESIEAYFPTSPDRAKLILELNAPAELLAGIKERALKTMVFPSGDAKVEISPQDMPAIEALTAKSITYIPPVWLTAEEIENQFGKATQQVHDADGNLHLLYPALGLDAIILLTEKNLLQFVAPDQFHRITSLLENLAEKTGSQ